METTRGKKKKSFVQALPPLGCSHRPLPAGNTAHGLAEQGKRVDFEQRIARARALLLLLAQLWGCACIGGRMDSDRIGKKKRGE